MAGWGVHLVFIFFRGDIPVLRVLIVLDVGVDYIVCESEADVTFWVSPLALVTKDEILG